MAGKLFVLPLTDSGTFPRKPEIRYVEGDSVSFTVAESTNDFLYLTGNNARKAHEFYPLVPKLGEITRDSGTIKVPLLAIQVTLFPNRGSLPFFDKSVIRDLSSVEENIWGSIATMRIPESPSKESIYEGASLSLKYFESIPVKSIGVAGSPKFDIYGMDFGWGKPKKCEIISIDYVHGISVSTSSLSGEDIEIGLVLPKFDMYVFETIFINGLNKVLY